MYFYFNYITFIVLKTRCSKAKTFWIGTGEHNVSCERLLIREIYDPDSSLSIMQANN